MRNAVSSFCFKAISTQVVQAVDSPYPMQWMLLGQATFLPNALVSFVCL